jgi:hypothetical protein
MNEKSMHNPLKLNHIRIAFAAAAGFTASIVSGRAQDATATISGVAAGGGNYDYTITLQNTGSDNLNSFWYGWTQGGNNLPSNPTTPANSLGWANNLDGNSIQWVNSTGTALAPGQSGTFNFVSSSSPSAITTSPSGESVAYVGGIDFSEGSSGSSTPVFSPGLQSVPEPSTLSLLVAGVFVLAGSFRSRAVSRVLRRA